MDNYYTGELAKHPKVFKTLKLKNAKYLGSGAWGSAFLLKNGRVVKVTNDPDEAKAAYKLSGKRMKFVVKIHAVYRLKGPGVESMYAIVQERLTGLSNKEIDAGWSLSGAAGPDASAKEFHKTNGHIYTAKKRKSMKAKLGEAMYGMRRTMEAQGVHWEDMHPYNIMKDKKGNYKAIDLQATVKGVRLTQIPVLKG